VTEAGGEPVIFLSNRGPVQFDREDGQRTTGRGGGGLVTALSGLAGRIDDAVWVCSTITEEDAVVAGEHDGKAFDAGEGSGELFVRMVDTDPDERQKYYSIIANPLLWFVQHYLWALSDSPDITRRELDAFESGYVPVNERFAEVVAEEVEARGGSVTVMVQDYHFYLVPELLRERCPDVFLHHFIHTPWPQPDAWRVLPEPMRTAVLTGVLGNDIVAFHTEHYARNFLLGCQELLNMDVDLKDYTVAVGDRTVLARWYPISIDPDALEERAASAEVCAREEELAARRREHLILRVDRADLSKNIVRWFKAYDVMLEAHPELLERVTFLALIQPSRTDVEEYSLYMEKIRRVVADVNLKHGTADWQPIDLRLQDDMDTALAAYKLFDLLVVNAIFDGMNLVATEAVVVNQRDGVLALSENTGAHEEMGAFALTVHPFDIEQQAEAFYMGLMMDAEERKDRHAACEATVRGNDIDRWLKEQLADVRKLRREAVSPS
jgi:trehalose 6-phosphate synthase